MSPRVITAAFFFFAFLATADAGTLKVPQQFATIQSAVMAAQADDVILVSKGKYPEVVDLNGKSGVTLRGKGVVLVVPPGAAPGVIVQNCSGVVIEHLSVEDSPLSGIHVQNSPGTVVRECRVKQCLTGIQIIAGSPASVLLRNRIEDVSGIAIRFDDSAGSTASDNRVSGAGFAGIVVTGSPGVTASDNRITGTPRGMSISLNANAVALLGNRVSNAAMAGIAVEGCVATSIIGNTVKTAGFAITVEAPGSTVFGNHVHGAGFGIAVFSSDMHVRDNLASGMLEAGVYLLLATHANVIRNRVRKSKSGILIADSTGAILLDNRVTRSSGAAYTVSSGANGNSLTGNRSWSSAYGIVLVGNENSLLANKWQKSKEYDLAIDSLAMDNVLNGNVYKTSITL